MVDLTERQERILAAVCRDYVMTGTEVSSASLIRTHGFRWSSATIRQELATLERLGLLHRPHRSAGRRPTSAGLSYYVATLPHLNPRPQLVAVVDRGLRGGGGQHLASDLQAISYVLSEVAGCVAVSFWGESRAGEIADIDVVPVVGARALIVMTMSDRSTVMHRVSLARLQSMGEVAQTDELRRLQTRLRELCRGRTLELAKAELSRRQREREAQFDARLAEALDLARSLCAEASFDPFLVQIAGQPSLARDGRIAGLDEVLALLEDVHQLADVLCQILPDEPEVDVRAHVHVGVESTPKMHGMTLIGCRLPPMTEGQTGAVALLGSDRIDYATVIPLVEYAARTLATHTG